MNESIFFNNLKGVAILVLWIKENSNKDFRVKAVKERNSDVLNNFIISYIERGNKIITDGWPVYTFLNEIEVYDLEDFNHGVELLVLV